MGGKREGSRVRKEDEGRKGKEEREGGRREGKEREGRRGEESYLLRHKATPNNMLLNSS